jgi:mono/diheme cytochrome c family protein
MTWRLIAVLVLGVLGPALAAESEDTERRLYLRYCGACHGPAGKGDGIAGTVMRPKPADLTRIAKQNEGDFPYARVVDVIDGRTTVRAHGDPDMPVWGEIFEAQAGWEEARRVEARGRIMLITDYLRSIQEK